VAAIVPLLHRFVGHTPFSQSESNSSPPGRIRSAGISPPEQYESILRLLTTFAQHLGAQSNLFMVQEQTAEARLLPSAHVYFRASHGRN